MQEHQVTIGDHTIALDEPFFVVATMNPYDGVGTYTLPEATLDRFMLSYELGYPTAEMEARILAQTSDISLAEPICSHQEIIDWTHAAKTKVFVDPKIFAYVARIMEGMRAQAGEALLSGVSTRAALGVCSIARVYALIQGRDFVIPEDIKYLVPFVLRHRIKLTYSSISSGLTVDTCIQNILDRTPIEYAHS